MAQPEVKQFNVYLPVKLIREIKYAAIEEERSLSALVREAIKSYLADPKRRARDRRRAP